MNITFRIVTASHGWGWIRRGMQLFMRCPAQWLMMIVILFVVSRVLVAIPLAGLLVILLWPVFLAGLSHGAQAVSEGKPLRFGYLVAGFLKNASSLVTVGGILLIGHLAILMVMTLIGGDAMSNVAKSMGAGGATPETVKVVEANMREIKLALLAGLMLWVPVTMAGWFAPLLVYFNDLKPMQALAYSLIACVRNVLPFLVYGLVVMVPIIVLSPLSLATRQLDLALWLLWPVLVPSIFASYKDVFETAPDGEQHAA